MNLSIYIVLSYSKSKVTQSKILKRCGKRNTRCGGKAVKWTKYYRGVRFLPRWGHREVSQKNVLVEETETGTQTFDSFSETIELRSRQETEMEPTLGETPDVELTLRSVDERIKQATDPILRRVEELCALLASRAEMDSAGNSEASGSRRDREFSSPSCNRCDNALLSWLATNNNTKVAGIKNSHLENLMKLCLVWKQSSSGNNYLCILQKSESPVTEC